MLTIPCKRDFHLPLASGANMLSTHDPFSHHWNIQNQYNKAIRDGKYLARHMPVIGNVHPIKIKKLWYKSVSLLKYSDIYDIWEPITIVIFNESLQTFVYILPACQCSPDKM